MTVLSAGSRRAIDRQTETHYVYELWDHHRCLYVGITHKLGARLQTHARKEWWPDVKRVLVEAHVDRSRGIVAEKDLIEEYHPVYNKQGVL